MPQEPAEPHVTSSGKEVPNAPHRIKYAIELLTSSGYSKARDELVATFGICPRTAASDIKEAYRLIAEDAEAERPHLRTRETERMTRIAVKAESTGQLAAAIAASARIAKLNGLDVETLNLGGEVTPEVQAMLAAMSLSPKARKDREAELKERIKSRAKEPAPAKSDDDEPDS